MLILPPCVRRTLSGLAFLALVAGCRPGPPPRQDNSDLSVSGEVYKVLCKHVAATTHPNDLSGESFNPACEGKGPAPDADPKFAAMVENRDSVVLGLSYTLADQKVVSANQLAATFDKGELDDMLARLVPFYDPPDEVIPNATRTLASTIRTWLDPQSAPGKEGIAALSALSGRDGYRPLSRALGPVTSLFDYDRLDDVTLSTLKLLDDGGPAHDPLLHLLTALGMQLAEKSSNDPANGDKTSLELGLELMTSSSDALASGNGPIYSLKRDVRGLPVPNAKLKGMFEDADGDGLPDASGGQLKVMGGAPLPTPFPLRNGGDQFPRDDQGRALVSQQDPEPLFEYYDLDRSLLGALTRDSADLVTRPAPDQRSPVENLLHGLSVAMGPRTQRTEEVGGRMIAFEGPDPAKSPLLDLMYAAGVYFTYPEMRDGLQLLKKLMTEQESAAAELLYAGLKVNDISDNYPDAQLVGQDGSPDTPHEFWDDLIQLGRRIKMRPGMIEAVIRAFADPTTRQNALIIGDLMRWKDQVTWPNPDPNNFVAADVNGDVTTTKYVLPVDRTMPNVGENRSAWQRILNVVGGLDDTDICNKQGAELVIQVGLPFGPYDRCKLFNIPNAVEFYNQSLLGRSQVTIVDPGLAGLSSVSCPLLGIGCVGNEQTQGTQIDGFTDHPTIKSIHRFMFAPYNDWSKQVFERPMSRDGIPVNVLEPYGLLPLEVVDPVADVTYIDSANKLFAAFDDTELRDKDGNLVDGYVFGHLLAMLHSHWPNHFDGPCPGPPDLICTQNTDPKAKLYAKQTGLASYEELLAQAFIDEGLIDALHHGTQALTQIKLDDGRDGVTVLAALLERLLTPADGVTYRDGRAVAYTNTNNPVVTFDAKPDATGDLPPIYLLLDALKGIDNVFAANSDSGRHDAWLAARSALVDQFLTAEKTADDTYQFKNRRLVAVTPLLIDFIDARIQKHIDLDDLSTWGPSLADKLQDTVAHPASAAGLDVVDGIWNDDKASAELAGLLTHMLSDKDPVAFAAMIETVVQALQFLQNRDPADAIARALALLLEPTAFDPGQPDSQAGKSPAMWGIRLVTRVIEAFQDQLTQPDSRTSLNKLLRNTVHPVDGDGRPPVLVFLDAIWQVQRVDPTKGSYGFFSEDDVRSLLTQTAEFLDDKAHGLERLFEVIQHRNLDQNGNSKK